jgi:hypothetical protein
VVNALQRIRKSLMLRNSDVVDPTSEGIHEARKAIDNELYDSQGRPRDVGSATAKALGDYRRMIDEALGNAGPIKQVDAKRAQIGKEERAFSTGQELYDTGRGQASPVEFQRTWDAMTPGEQQATLNGVNVETYRQLGINSNDLVKLQSLMKGEGKWNQQKLATVIGEDKAASLMDAISREKTFQESYNKVVQGSKTAESIRQPARGFGQAVSGAVPEVGAAMLAGGPKAGGLVALSHLRRYLTERVAKSGQPQLQAGVARLLSSDRPQDLLEALRVIEQHQSQSVPGAILGALLARQQQQQQQGGQR